MSDAAISWQKLWSANLNLDWISEITLNLVFENLNLDSDSDAAIFWWKLGFENWNSDSNSEVAISWLKLGF